MVCSRCGSANAATATVCAVCGAPVDRNAPATGRPGPGSRSPLGLRPGLAPPQGKVDTSWLPRAQPRPSLTRAATSLVSHRPASIWQAQTHDAPGARPGPLSFSQGVSAALIPGVLLCAIYGTYQAVWRRGIFAAIADDPIGVSIGGAHRSDTLNLVLLVFTVVSVVVAVSAGAWWIRRHRLARVFRSSALWVAAGTILCVVAAMLCQGGSAVVISYAYVVGAVGTFAIGGALAFVLGRAIQSVMGDLRWVPQLSAHLPAKPRSGTGISAAGLATLTGRRSAGRLDTTGLVPVRPERPKADWSSLKRK